MFTKVLECFSWKHGSGAFFVARNPPCQLVTGFISHAPTCGELESPLEITLGEFYLMNCGTVGVPEFHLDNLSVDSCLVAKAHPKASTSFCHTI